MKKPGNGDLDSDVLRGIAAGEFATGAVETVVGGTIDVGAGIGEVGTGGVATPVAVPALVAGTALVTAGVANVAASSTTLQMANNAADRERQKNIAKGVPASALGPSGKPKIHTTDLPNRKAAQDAAKSAGAGTPMEHPPNDVQPPHFHPTDKKGNKIPGPHYNYPKR